ncbi:MAG: phenylalanyl-tRNA synthetase alpha chain [Thermoleophilaceae bacterium]|jgi:phenylalanyl-tRNA synthetase alpha chain|nr:phenylalanyl-tRNA synthetase alpha chain [Thermoleophilaceae bacterium]
MADAASRLEEIRREAERAVADASAPEELEEIRVRYLGRKSELTVALRSIGDLPPEERGRVGQAGNAVRQALETLIGDRIRQLEDAELEARLAEDRIDVTLPGNPPSPAGRLHLITETRREIEDIFIGLGFSIAEGPEVEYDYYNFTSLNHPPGHPARMLQDTFYFSDDVLLRTHTSPMQTRTMEVQDPPIYIVIPGKVYRRDSDATHTPMFHQVEGLAVDENITLADLQGVLLEFARAIFGPEREIRLRPHYFPFTEPSVEVDVSCFACGGTGVLPGGGRDNLCKGSGWIEILGSGMVDPNVFGFVDVDPERYQGFAFGMGIERIAMLRHGVPDLRLFFDNDLPFLEQFG